MTFYAKTYTENGKWIGESIQDHTENLVAGIEQLRKFFREEIEQQSGQSIWEDLKIACLVHDLGKLSTPFQNKIRRILGKAELASQIKFKEVPHNYLSPAFLAGLPELQQAENRQRFNKLLYSIAFHHDRHYDSAESNLQAALNDISIRAGHLVDWLKKHLQSYSPPELCAFYHAKLKSYLDGNNASVNNLKLDKYFILLKGLLHRLDYAASAHLSVETDRLGDPSSAIEVYLSNKNFRLRPFQQEAVKYRAQSVMLTASTGIGKTEFALNWLGDSKGFYTLPLRVSVNAMYKRVSKIFPDKTALLHSDSHTLHLDNEQLSIEDSIQRFDESRQFAYPLIVTTADQLFTSVFKWPGYERIYATLMYSKVILDEPQSYSPKTLAMIIRALEELASYGSKFCYMSATQHPFIIKKLSRIAKQLGPVYHSQRKHKVQLVDDSIDALKSQVVDSYKKEQKKILIIANTVKKSQELFIALKKDITNVHLLHSGFIKMHRDAKEKSIQDDDRANDPNGNPVVWITTQIVEASLDIDYDILFTEIATLDALIQRMGRIFRGTEREIGPSDSPNIIIACAEPSDKGWIYDKDIVKFTKDALSNFQNKILSELDKQTLINFVLDEEKLRGTRFLKEFTNAYNLLEFGFQASNKNEAQRLFREINQISAIPESVYASNEKEIDSLINLLQSKIPRPERFKANTELNKFLVSIPAYKDKGNTKLFNRKSQSIYLIPAEYSDTLGLQYNKIEYVF